MITPGGALILREHHCTSAPDAAFLDITHGLYSLAWSEPIEWPNFLAEYQAWYRTKEEWTALLHQAGFRRHGELDPQYERLYSANSYLKGRGAERRFTNLIKAYYAVYVPLVGHSMPKHIADARVVVREDGSDVRNGSEQNVLNPRQKRRREEGTSADTAESLCVAIATIPMNDTSMSLGSKCEILPSSSPTPHTAGTGMHDIYESGTHRGHYYVFDKAGKSVWISVVQLLDVDHTLCEGTNGGARNELGSDECRINEKCFCSFVHPISGENVHGRVIRPKQPK